MSFSPQTGLSHSAFAASSTLPSPSPARVGNTHAHGSSQLHRGGTSVPSGNCGCLEAVEENADCDCPNADAEVLVPLVPNAGGAAPNAVAEPKAEPEPGAEPKADGAPNADWPACTKADTLDPPPEAEAEADGPNPLNPPDADGGAAGEPNAGAAPNADVPNADCEAGGCPFAEDVDDWPKAD